MRGAANSGCNAVIAISSHVVRGTVGNRAAVFALETLGHPVWAMPTIVLPWHPGHGRATRIVAPAGEFEALMADLARAPWLAEVGGVVSGYLGHEGQADAIANLVAAVKAQNPQAIYVCDPVMGDVGGLYVPEATAAAIRDRLIPLADVATPNRHELNWMMLASADDALSLARLAGSLGPAHVVVTSTPALMTGSIGNLLVSGGEAWMAEHRLIADAPNGVGDLTSAVFLSRMMSGLPLDNALQTTTATVFEIIARTVKRGGDELQIEADPQSLSRPMAMVQMRRLSMGGGRRA
ncbi:MAG: pyridoxal kinase PdxY [Mesorhizobium sp.]